MKLLITPTSPYARKARIVILEKGIDCETANTNPWEDSPAVLEANPLRKVPILKTDKGDLVDSRVICEYLDSLSEPRLLPQEPTERAMVQSTLAVIDGAIDAATALLSLARVAPAATELESWKQWQANKIINTLDRFEPAASELPGDKINMVDITLGCLLLTLPRVEVMHLERGFNVDGDYPNLSLWRNTINKRESFSKSAPLGL